MKGYIEKRGERSWRLTVELPRGLDGRRSRRRVTVQGTKRDAQAALNKLLTEVQSGISIDPSKATLGSYLLEKWLPIKVGSVSPKSAERYKEAITLHIIPALGHIPISKLKPLHIQAYYQESAESGRRDGEGGLSPRSIAFHHAILHKALKDAVKWEVITRNPADAVMIPKADRYRADVLSAQDTVRLFLRAQGTPYYIPILLAATTGMRRGEICALRWEDVDLDAGTLAVRRTLQRTKAGLHFREPKSSNSIRVVALLPMTVNALREHREKQEAHKIKVQELGMWQDHGLVYCRSDGQPYIPDSLTTNFKRVLKVAKLPPRLRFHDLRHTHATLLLEQGVHPKVVQERLGHASISMTMDIYSHVMPTVQKDAARQLERLLVEANVPNMSPIGSNTGGNWLNFTLKIMGIKSLTR